MTHQMRRYESGRKLCSLKNPMKSIQPRSSPPKHVALLWRHPLLSPRLHSIRFLFSLPFSPSLSYKTRAPLLLIPRSEVETRAELPCFLTNSFFFSSSASSSAAMSEVAAVVDAEYMAEIERARRDLRALIASKNCAPIMLRLAYVLSLFR